MSKRRRRNDFIEREPFPEVEEVRGFVPEEEPVEELKEEKGKVVNCERLNLRKEPNTDCAIVDVLEKGTEMTILSDDILTPIGWYKVTVNGVGGFVMSKFIEKE